MNKNLKKIIAVALAFGAFSTISLTTDLNVKPAYAASYHARSGELESLSLESSKGNDLPLRIDGYYGEDVDVNSETTYYTIVKDKSSSISIDAEAKGNKKVVKIFTSNDNDARPYSVNDDIPIMKGETTLYIRVYSSNEEFKEAKNESKLIDECEKKYELKILKTEASSNEDNVQDSVYLSDLKISKDKNFEFVKSVSKYDIKFDENKKNTLITAIPESKDYKVYIKNGSDSEKELTDEIVEDNSEKYSKRISLEKGKNEVKIRVVDVKNNYKTRTYTINILNGKEEEALNDEIYLKTIDINNMDIDFDEEEETSYSKTVKNDVDEITIKAEPKDNMCLVTVDRERVLESRDYEIDVKLKEGKNVIPIVVKDESNDLTRKYTLTINREKLEEDEKTDEKKEDNGSGNTSGPSTSTTISSNWVKDATGYQYKKDGVISKNTWILDEVSKDYYFVNENGYRVVGWKKWNGSWYLLGNDGVMLTGWQIDGSTWYYLNADGAMKTGWLKDNKSGLWYYLNGSGSMKTGWHKSGSKWYYLNSGSGEMKTGWINEGGKKYYLNSQNGDMVTGRQYIDGKYYTFDGSGALK